MGALPATRKIPNASADNFAVVSISNRIRPLYEELATCCYSDGLLSTKLSSSDRPPIVLSPRGPQLEPDKLPCGIRAASEVVSG